MKRLSKLLFLAVALSLSWTMINAQTYTVSPSGWTSKPSQDLTYGSSKIIAATSEGVYIRAKAVDNSNGTITCYVKKSSGTFNNSVKVTAFKDLKISGGTITSQGTSGGKGSGNSGDSEISFVITPDFATGSHTYTLILASGSIKFYTNPITITASDQNSLTTPDNTAFSASNITTNSFTAKWPSVTGATKYNINVKKASDSDYSKPVFTKSGITSTSCNVTGLQPGTSYYFQVQAANSTQNSAWSNSIPNVVTTKSESDNIVLASTGSFGTTTLTKWNTYTYNVKVKNGGSSSWSGTFYLRAGSSILISWSKTISSGATITLTGDYTPNETGNKTLTLYYQTNGSSTGVMVPQGSFSNPIVITVTEESDITAPSATTWEARNITSSSATLWAVVNPNGASTSYAFWWGTSSSSLDNHNNLTTLPAGTSNVSVEYELTGLTPNTTYYYQIAATNSAGVKRAAMRSFTTTADQSEGDYDDSYPFETIQWNNVPGENRKVVNQLFLDMTLVPNGGEVKKYYISAHEVQRDLWAALMGTEGPEVVGPGQTTDSGAGEVSPKFHQLVVGDEPVKDSISATDIQAFISVLRKQTGKLFRLPTEAERLRAAQCQIIDTIADATDINGKGFYLALDTIGQSEEKMLVITAKDGSQTQILLDEMPKISIKKPYLVINTGYTSLSYPLERLKHMHYEKATDELTSINEIKVAEETIEESIDIDKLPIGADIRIYTLDGKQLCSTKVSQDMTHSLLISSMQSGIYVVKVNDKTYKFQKP